MLSICGAARAEDFHPSKVNIPFDHLYNFEEMTKHLRDLTNAYPDLLNMKSIGKSFEGRDLWLITLNNPKTGADTTKPAIYIDGNIHGNEVQAAEVPLYLLWYLTRSYGKAESLTRLVDDYAFYVIPMVNPDGRAYWFDSPNTPDSSRTGKKPTDNDNDGLLDEDGPDDLNGDGQILQMRRRNPNGRWKDNPTDARLMVPCKPGEPGQYDRLGLEGIDNDGDGSVNEDGPGGYDLNRNWPTDWQPEYMQFGASEFPLSHPESRAIATFVETHPNIAAAQAFHNAGGMILRGPGAQYTPEYPGPDVAVYDHLGQKGEEMLPFYRYMISWKDLYTVHGGFIEWTFEGLGIFSFTNELWTGDQMFNKKSESGFFGRGEDMIKFDDLLLFGQTFKAWTPFKHPVYGDVEIGGFVKFSQRVPPGFMLAELCHRNAAFCIFHAQAMPKLEFVKTEVVSRGSDLWQVTAHVRNVKIIPTVAALADQHNIGNRDYIEIKPTTATATTQVAAGSSQGTTRSASASATQPTPSPLKERAGARVPTTGTSAPTSDSHSPGQAVRVIAGGAINDPFYAPFVPVEHQPQRLWVDGGVRGEETRLFRWIVTGSGNVEISYHSDKAKSISTVVELKAP